MYAVTAATATWFAISLYAMCVHHCRRRAAGFWLQPDAVARESAYWWTQHLICRFVSLKLAGVTDVMVAGSVDRLNMGKMKTFTKIKCFSYWTMTDGYCLTFDIYSQIPFIGHFLYMCQTALFLEEVSYYELERAFAAPRQSSLLRRIYTSLLSTPYQRTR